MKHVISFLAISSMLVFLSCSPEYEGNVGGASDPSYCKSLPYIPEGSINNDLSNPINEKYVIDGVQTTSDILLTDKQKSDYISGCEIYVVKCANCHMLNGDTLNESVDLNDAMAIDESLCPTCEEHSVLTNKIYTSMPPARGDSMPLSEIEADKVSTYMRIAFYKDATPYNDLEHTPVANLYDKYCAVCHGDEGQGSGIFNAEMTQYTMKKETLIQKLETGGTLSGYAAGNGSSADAPMDQASDAPGYNSSDFADYLNERFDYGW